MRTLIEVKRIELWSLFKLSFLLYFAFGLVVGIFYGFFIVIASIFQEAFLEEELMGLGVLGGVFGLFLIPVIALFYGAVGSVSTTVGGLVFNLVAGLTGGIRLETSVLAAEPQPTPGAPTGSNPGGETRPTI